MKIYIASDHAGFVLKNALIPYLKELGHEPVDMGAFELEPKDDYPQFIQPCAKRVASEANVMGIVIGGSGQGEAMVANRVQGARAAVFYGKATPQLPIDIDAKTVPTDNFMIVRMARVHNDANILSLGARFLTIEEGKEAVRIFLETPFSENPRHVRRINEF